MLALGDARLRDPQTNGGTRIRSRCAISRSFTRSVDGNGIPRDGAEISIATTPRGTPAAAALRHERASFQANAYHMDDPAFRAQGVAVGSGAAV